MTKSGSHKLQLLGVLTLLLLAATGCEEKVIHPSFATLREVSDKPRDTSPSQHHQLGESYDPTGGSGWSIPLASFEGPQRFKEIEQTRRELRDMDLPTMWFEDVQGKATIYCGRFDSAATTSTQQTLERIRKLEINGEKPYAHVKLIPLVGGHRVKLDPLDLQQFVGFFTLQVAAFTEKYPGDRRVAAEQMARELRQRGEEAYFYHGPRTSSVCIGLFTYDDFVTIDKVSHYGPRIKALQKRYPYNLIDPPTGTLPQPQATNTTPEMVSIPTPRTPPAETPPAEGSPDAQPTQPTPSGEPTRQPSILFRVI